MRFHNGFFFCGLGGPRFFVGSKVGGGRRWIAALGGCHLKILSNALGPDRFFFPAFFLPRPFMFLRLANIAAVLVLALLSLLLKSVPRLGLVYFLEVSLGFSTKSSWSWIEGSEREHSPWRTHATNVPARPSPPRLG